MKRERVETLKKKAESGQLSSHDATDADTNLPPKLGHLVFFDPTDLHWLPDIGNGYAPKGEQIKVDSPGVENPWCALFGSLSYPTGEGLYTIHERKRHQEVQVTRNQFYESLMAQCEAVVDWLTKLPFAEFCSIMGIDEADLVSV